MIRSRSFVPDWLFGAFLFTVAWTPAAVTPAPARAATGPLLRIAERKIDFGTVDQFQQLHHVLVMRNNGDAPLKILKIDTSCGCTVGVPADSVVLPGTDVKIDITFSTREYEGPQEKTLTITTNDPGEPIVHIAVTVDVKPYVRMDPTTIHFDPVRKGETAAKTVRFAADKDFGLEIGTITGGEDLLKITTRKEPSSKEVVYVLTVALRPDAPAGQFRTLVKIEMKGRVTRTFDLLATGAVISYFVVKTDDIRLRMPTAVVGKSATARVEITCDGTKPYRLSGVETSLPFLTGEIVPQGKDFEIVLTVAPNAPVGDYKGKIVIKTTDPAQPEIDLIVMGYVRA